MWSPGTHEVTLRPPLAASRPQLHNHYDDDYIVFLSFSKAVLRYRVRS